MLQKSYINAIISIPINLLLRKREDKAPLLGNPLCKSHQKAYKALMHDYFFQLLKTQIMTLACLHVDLFCKPPISIHHEPNMLRYGTMF